MKSAVVIGGSMAGLLAARVLADHFERVTVVERDPAPDSTDPRRGVPQGSHAHVILLSGARTVEHLFPGITGELAAGGSVPFDFSADVLWHVDGVVLMRYPSGHVCLSSTRPHLEENVRRRLAALPNVNFRHGSSVTGLVEDPRPGRVSGVQVHGEGDSGQTEIIAADLTVDAGGRGSKARGWLERLGYSRPPQSTVTFGLSYATQLYERRSSASRDWKVTAVSPQRPHETRGVILMPVEGNRWMLTLQTYSTARPPENQAEMLEYLRSLPRHETLEEIKGSTPLTPIHAYKYAGQVRHHFARLAKLPEGFIAIGDAACSFDPVFGQGMSVAALEARLLDDLLRSRANQADETRLIGLPRTYFRGLDKILDPVWLLTSNEAFKYPATTGDRPFGVGSILQWYTRQLFQLAATDRAVYDDFIGAMHMIAPSNVLFGPAVVGKALARSIAQLRPKASAPAFAPVPTR